MIPFKLIFRSSLGLVPLYRKSSPAASLGPRAACCCSRVKSGKVLKGPQFSTSLTSMPCLTSQILTCLQSVHLDNKPLASTGGRNRDKQGRKKGWEPPRGVEVGKGPQSFETFNSLIFSPQPDPGSSVCAVPGC